MVKRKMSEAQKAALAKGQAKLGLKAKGGSDKSSNKDDEKEKKDSKEHEEKESKEEEKDEEKKEKKPSKEEIKKTVEDKNAGKKEESFIPLSDSSAFKIIKENVDVFRNFFNSKSTTAIVVNEAEMKQLNIGYNEFCERFHATFMSFAQGNGQPSMTNLLDLYEAGIMLFVTMFSNKEFGIAFTVLNNLLGISGMMNILTPDAEIEAAATFISYFEKALSLLDSNDYVFTERINLLITELGAAVEYDEDEENKEAYDDRDDDTDASEYDDDDDSDDYDSDDYDSYDDDHVEGDEEY